LSSGSLIQVHARRTTSPGERPMEDAAYLRSQAELCLEIAQQMSDPVAAQELRLKAAQYLARATKTEASTGPVAQTE
jgi:hypothetical protein